MVYTDFFKTNKMRHILKLLTLFVLLCMSSQVLGQYTGGRLQDTRINVSIGVFSAGGVGDYQGAVGTLGSTGYTTNNIVVGDYLIDDTDLYRIDAVVYTVPGSIATIDVTWLPGTVGSIKAPISGRGAVVKPTSNLGLLLLLQNGSNFITEEQEAKILTHNFLVLDSLLLASTPDIYLATDDQILTEPIRRIAGTTSQLLRFDTLNIQFQDNPLFYLTDVDDLFADTRKSNVFASDSLILGVTQGTGKLFLNPVNTTSSLAGDYLKLIDPTTGEAVWDDLKGIEGLGQDTLTIVFPDTTYNVTQGDTIYIPSSPQWYNAGNGAWVYATGPGVTYTKSPGIGDFNIPSGVILNDFKIVGASSDLNSGELMLDINYPGSVAWNQSDASSLWPVITPQNRTVVLSNDPYQQKPDDAGDSIDIFNERWTTAGKVTVKITGLSGDFGLHGSGM